MAAEADSDAVVVADLVSLELAASQPVIYDAPIGIRLLYADPGTGAEHYLVDYPAGMKAARHHHTAAHTVVVLDGAMEVNGRVLGPGSYCHFPARTSMHHQPADGRHCRFVTIFHGPFDVVPEA
jgi:quercetin dioxygenase-like cupin family protein